MENNTVEQSDLCEAARAIVLRASLAKRAGFTATAGITSDQIDALERALAAQAPLRARIETLEAALEPFDDALGEDDEFSDDTPITAKWGRTTHYALTLGNLRRARDARNALGRKG